MAAIVQRSMNNSSNSNEAGLSEQERNELMEIANRITAEA